MKSLELILDASWRNPDRGCSKFRQEFQEKFEDEFLKESLKEYQEESLERRRYMIRYWLKRIHGIRVDQKYVGFPLPYLHFLNYIFEHSAPSCREMRLHKANS